MSHPSQPAIDTAMALAPSRTRIAVKIEPRAAKMETPAPLPGGGVMPTAAPAVPPAPVEPPRPSYAIREAAKVTQPAIQQTFEAARLIAQSGGGVARKLRDSARRAPYAVPQTPAGPPIRREEP